ncbi:MAG: hypothetical protein AB1Z67_08090, partial [Candidatus Limnocylindrales bacterium]
MAATQALILQSVGYAGAPVVTHDGYPFALGTGEHRYSPGGHVVAVIPLPAMGRGSRALGGPRHRRT